MSGNDEVNQIDNAEYPAPTYEKEQYEYDDTQYVLLSEGNAQSYEQFNYPAYERENEQNYFEKSALTVKPLIKRHNFSPFIMINNIISHTKIMSRKIEY